MKQLCSIMTAIFLLLSLSACNAASELDQAAFRILCKGVEIALSADAAPIVAALGEPEHYTEEPSCAFDGFDKTYDYGSFYLATYPLGGNDYVYSVWFADSSIANEEGIRIGNTQKEVEAAYGAGCFDGTNVYIKVLSDSKMTIILTDGVVSSIAYEVLL